MAWPKNRCDQIRERILDSAARLFSMSGFDELIEGAGLTRVPSITSPRAPFAGKIDSPPQDTRDKEHRP